RRALQEAELPRRPLVVTVPADAAPLEIERAIDDTILADFAARAHGPQTDPVIRTRLIQNMRFVDDTLSDEAAVKRALELGMDRTDPVVRQRLEWLARQTLARATFQPPTDEELTAYVETHHERFATPPQVSFTQVFLSRQDRGEALQRDGAALAAELATRGTALGGTGRGSVDRLGDPSLLPRRLTWASARRIDGIFGVGFGSRVIEAADQEWTGPIESSFGLHFVYVQERRAGELPPLDQIGDRVAHDLERDRRDGRLRLALNRMRQAYAIQVEVGR
ncbi:MAG: peptidyl-prolyl cis-trans isomerase, partial [Deltaproteobacteria bacterium]|nr:peptidyl-prolyl cis-trans isomerase [Deltaproteobacteria bacterium]